MKRAKGVDEERRKLLLFITFVVGDGVKNLIDDCRVRHWDTDRVRGLKGVQGHHRLLLLDHKLIQGTPFRLNLQREGDEGKECRVEGK